MPLLVFWPLAGACGAGEVLPRCAQLLWCELYVMKDLQKEKKKGHRTNRDRRIDWRPYMLNRYSRIPVAQEYGLI